MADLNVRAIIEILLKGKGGADAKKILADVEQEAKRARKALDGSAQASQRTTKEQEKLGRASRRAASDLRDQTKATDRFGGAIAGLAKRLLAFFGIFQAIRFVRDRLVEFAQLERQLGATAIQMRNLGIAADAHLPRVVARLREIQRAGKGLTTETLPAFQRLVGITQDVDAAMALLELSVDIAESGMTGLGSAANNLVQILQGEAIEAAKRLGLQVRDTNGELKSGALLLEEVRRQYRGLADEVEDTQSGFDRLKGAAQDYSETILGSFNRIIVSPVLEQLAAKLDAYRRIQLAVANGAKATGLSIVASFSAAGKALREVFSAETLFDAFLPGGLAGRIGKAFEDEFAKFEPAIEGALAGARGAFSDAGEDAGEAFSEGFDRVLDQARQNEARRARQAQAGLLEARIAAAREGTAERLRLELELLALQEQAAIDTEGTTEEAREAIRATFRIKRTQAEADHARRRAAAALAAEARLVAARLQTAAAGTAERERLELELLDLQRRQAIAAADQTGEAVEAIEQRFDERRLAQEREHAEQRRRVQEEAAQDALRAQVAASVEGSQRRLELELELLDREYAERIRRAEEHEQDVTALRLAAALEREALVRQFVEGRADDALERQRRVQEAESELHRAQLDARAELARQGSQAAIDAALDQARFEASLREEQLEAERAEDLERIRRREDRAVAELAIARQQAQAEAVLLGEPAERLAERLAALDAEVAAIRRASDAERRATNEATTALIEANETRLAAATKKLEKAKQQAMTQSYLLAAQEIVASLQTIFGEHKAFAVAQAIISTANGVANMLGQLPFPLNVVVAGFVAAAGAAQVATILSTEPGSTTTPTVGGARASQPTGAQPAQAFPAATAGAEQPRGFAAGGVVDEGPTGTDQVPIRATLGETVVDSTPEEGRALAAGQALLIPTAVARRIGIGGRAVFRGRGTIVLRQDLADVAAPLAQEVRRDEEPQGFQFGGVVGERPLSPAFGATPAGRASAAVGSAAAPPSPAAFVGSAAIGAAQARQAAAQVVNQYDQRQNHHYDQRDQSERLEFSVGLQVFGRRSDLKSAARDLGRAQRLDSRSRRVK